MQALADQEFQDGGYDELVRRCARFTRLARDQSAYSIRDIAALYTRHRHHWQEFQFAHGIALKPRRGPLGGPRLTNVIPARAPSHLAA